jgi:YbbR domain-containing protein
MLKDNLGLRVFAMFLAVILWMQSILVSEQRSVVSFPLTLRDVPLGITLENIPEQLSFNVRGKGLDILRMILSKPTVSIDASMISVNTDQIPLQDYIIDLPENINVSFLGPSDAELLNIQADVFHQKSVPIRLDFANTYTQNRLSEMTYRITPETVTIFGSRSRLQNISMILTQSIDQEILSAGRAEINLVLPYDDVSLSEDSVTLSISGIQEATRVFTDVSLPAGHIPSRIAVRLQAPASILERISEDDIAASVMVNADESGLYPIMIVVPENVQVIAVTPDRVRKRQ